MAQPIDSRIASACEESERCGECPKFNRDSNSRRMKLGLILELEIKVPPAVCGEDLAKLLAPLMIPRKID